MIGAAYATGCGRPIFAYLRRSWSWRGTCVAAVASPRRLAGSFLRVPPRRRAAALAMGNCAAVRRQEEKAEQKPEDYTGLPKVELHVHLDGACRIGTLCELSRQHKLDYPHDDEEEFKKHVMLLSPAPSLEQFLDVFRALSSILCTKEAIERVSYEYCEEMERQNVVYFEIRYNPMGHRMEPEEYIEGVIAGLKRGERDFRVKSRHILVFLRNKPEHVSSIVDLALKYKSRGVVAVDIAGNELLPMDERFVQGFKRAKENGLHITVHAGESGPADNVRQAIEELGAERIGHGYHVLEDEAVYQLAREKKIHFEACLTSSIFTNSQTTSYESHAIRRWALDGTSFSLSTDDPGVIGNDLQMEYREASQKLGLSEDQLVQSVLNGVAAAFLPDIEKEKLLKQVEKEIVLWKNLADFMPPSM